jgi:hypothetical protein
MRIRHCIAVVGVAALVAVTGPAHATAPERFTQSEHVHEVVGSCGAGDDLVADFTITETVTEFSPNVGTLHLQLVGTITRTGTGVVGKYAERQRDFFNADGSERYVGALGHLIVPGGGGFTLAGQARQSPEGELSITPGLAPLLVIDFEAIVCDALAG